MTQEPDPTTPALLAVLILIIMVLLTHGCTINVTFENEVEMFENKKKK